jgi:hypothetical protein
VSQPADTIVDIAKMLNAAYTNMMILNTTGVELQKFLKVHGRLSGRKNAPIEAML